MNPEERHLKAALEALAAKNDKAVVEAIGTEAVEQAVAPTVTDFEAEPMPPLPTFLIKPLAPEHTDLMVSPEAIADQVNHPAHYARWAMEPIEFIAVNDLPWWLANVVKYTMRYDAKDGIADMYKARSYLDMKIAQLEGKKRFWEPAVAQERKLNGK